jgi:hypothetical protein
MKMLRVLYLIVFAVIINYAYIYAQDIEIHYLIGKKQNDVTKKYGNPVHKDNSNSDMVCLFYNNPNGTMVFVSDKQGVYQAEANVAYNTETDARNVIDHFIQASISNEFQTDTVTINDFKLHITGVNVELHIAENKINKKFEVRVKANRTEN